MKHVKTFKNFKIDESMVGTVGLFLIGASLPLILIFGGLWGWIKIRNLINYGKFKYAKNKLDFIFNKPEIQNDHELHDLLAEFAQQGKNLYYGEREYDPVEEERELEAQETLNRIYARIRELVTQQEYQKFISCMKEFDHGSEKPAGYIKNRENKFQGFGYTI